MPEYHPPVSHRSTGDLIEIAWSSNKEWREEIISLAKKELEKRNVSESMQLNYQKELNESYDLQMKIEQETETLKFELNKRESYKIWEMAMLFLLGPILIFHPSILYQETIFTLRREGYFLKFKQRIIIFILSFISWIFVINYEYAVYENEWQREIENEDISEWEKEFNRDQ